MRVHTVTRLGQTPMSSQAARFALENAVLWDPGIPPANLVGMLAVRSDGGQIVRLGWRVANTAYYTLEAGREGPWMSALVFDGIDHGHVVFIPLGEIKNWKLIPADRTMKLYTLVDAPGKWETSMTTATFAQHVENAYGKAVAALDAAEKGDKIETANSLDGPNLGAKANRDAARIELQVLMTLGVYTVEEATLAEKGILTPLKNSIDEVDAAVKTGQIPVIAQTRQRVAASAELAGNGFDQLAESAFARGLALYALSKKYVTVQGALLPRLPDFLRPGTQAAIASVGSSVEDLKRRFAQLGIDADAILSSAGGLSDLGQLMAILNFLGRAAGGAWKVGRKTAGALLTGKAGEQVTIGMMLAATGHTAMVGIIFHLSVTGFERWIAGRGVPKTERDQIEEWKKYYKLQSQAQKELAEEQRKAVEDSLRTDQGLGNGSNKLNPDPANEAKLFDLLERVKAAGVTLGPDEGLGIGTLLLSGAAAVGIGYWLYQRSKAQTA